MKNLLLLLLLLPLFTYGQDFSKKPANYVTSFDILYSKNFVLNKQEEELLNTKLRVFQDSTGIQLLIYVTTSRPMSLEDHSQKVFDAWGMGQTENGVLIIIFPSDQKFTVVGHGLKAILPYDTYMEVLDEEMKNHFQDENFYKGIDAGVDKLLYYSKHQYEPPGLLENIKKNKMEIIGVSALTLPFIIGIVAFLLKSKRRN